MKVYEALFTATFPDESVATERKLFATYEGAERYLDYLCNRYRDTQSAINELDVTTANVFYADR